MYAVVDRASKNIMGEFDSFAQAEAMLIDLVGAHPQAYREIVVVSDQGEATNLSPEQVREITWQHAPAGAA
jgi:hypothetical protein